MHLACLIVQTATHMCSHQYTLTHMHIHPCTHTLTHMHIHPCTHTLTHMHIHPCTHTLYTHTYTCTHMHSIRTRTYPPIYIHTHTCSQLPAFNDFARSQLSQLLYTVPLPEEGSLFDYCLDLNTYQFIAWTARNVGKRSSSGQYAILPEVSVHPPHTHSNQTTPNTPTATKPHPPHAHSNQTTPNTPTATKPHPTFWFSFWQ